MRSFQRFFENKEYELGERIVWKGEIDKRIFGLISGLFRVFGKLRLQFRFRRIVPQSLLLTKMKARRIKLKWLLGNNRMSGVELQSISN